MKIKTLAIVCMVLVFAAFLGGCGCFQAKQEGVKPAPAPTPPPPTQPPAPVPVTPPPAPAVDLKDINFDFDKSNIRSDAAEILKGNTGWFNANPGKKVRVEGHCDERGTVEYNLALGQRRADSTKAYMSQLGVDARLLETVSYGKEKPLCTEHNEDCWAKNRRAHFLVLP